MKGPRDAEFARELAAVLSQAACAGRGVWWSRQEQLHAAASTPTAAARAADVALALCAQCPASRGCRELAVVDRYSGLSAGAVYINGTAHHSATVLHQPDPPVAVRRSSVG